MLRKLLSCLLLVCALLVIAGCNRENPDSKVIRMGGFPNVTHVQALVARNMSRHGEGWFERRRLIFGILHIIS
ncbi:MAG: hypothetical protein IIX85_10020 [Clostridia bacterium]|nr:hypothetical protein [Clostridia bacterium]